MSSESSLPHVTTEATPNTVPDHFRPDPSCEPIEPDPACDVGDHATDCAGGSMPPDVGLDQMPPGVCFLHLEPGWGRPRHLCLACDRHEGSILAFGYGVTRGAARRAACEDLRDMRRGRVTLATTHLTLPDQPTPTIH